MAEAVSSVALTEGPDITIQNITGERFLHGNERSGLREGSSAASFFPQGWNFFPAGLERSASKVDFGRVLAINLT